ncbi:methionyl-tRNA formyltransferase [Photorhabdus laumondii]|uniref:methionyl-tRNA formyltransferase n=1 Tax=Photorhabdus laumondii TaxID=2218628 RepID=UPI003315ADCA
MKDNAITVPAQIRPLRVLVSGQSDFGAATLRAVKERGHIVPLFICTNRNESVQDIAEHTAYELGIEMLRVSKLDAALTDQLGRLVTDVGLMAYVTLKAHSSFLSLPRHGSIQYHPSLLPQYRGPSAINWAIINGEKTTGFTIFRPNEILDDGDILLQYEAKILEDESAGELYRRILMPEGVKALVQCMELVAFNGLKGQRQNSSLATYQSWCTRDTARINWELKADEIHNLIRGCDPRPGAWSYFSGERFAICKSRISSFYPEHPTDVPLGAVVALTTEHITVKCGHGYLDILEYRDDVGKRCPVARLIQYGKFSVEQLFFSE